MTKDPRDLGLDTEFKRGMGAFDATMVVVGSMVGCTCDWFTPSAAARPRIFGQSTPPCARYCSTREGNC